MLKIVVATAAGVDSIKQRCEVFVSLRLELQEAHKCLLRVIAPWHGAFLFSKLDDVCPGSHEDGMKRAEGCETAQSQLHGAISTLFTVNVPRVLKMEVSGICSTKFG